VATAAGGALLGELDRRAQAFGLACPTGHVSHTGVGGLTLGGGVGRLTRRHGLTLDNLLGVELVTAEGERVRADVGTEPELFWGLRGAGPNFGIATSFELALHPVGPEVLAGIAVYPIERAREVAAAFTAAMAAAPDEVTAGMGWFVAPPGPPFPPAVAGRPVVVVNATHGGPLPGADRDLAPLRALGPALDTFAPGGTWTSRPRATTTTAGAGATTGRACCWRPWPPRRWTRSGRCWRPPPAPTVGSGCCRWAAPSAGSPRTPPPSAAARPPCG
jgi:FAD/FMN-containing dehydrogenase